MGDVGDMGDVKKASRVRQALALVDAGSTVLEAALAQGIAPQGVYEALKRRVEGLVSKRQIIAGRACAECGAALADTARPNAKTCGSKCRQRAAARRKAALAKVNAERARLGLPPLLKLSS